MIEFDLEQGEKKVKTSESWVSKIVIILPVSESVNHKKTRSGLGS